MVSIVILVRTPQLRTPFEITGGCGGGGCGGCDGGTDIDSVADEGGDKGGDGIISVYVTLFVEDEDEEEVVVFVDGVDFVIIFASLRDPNTVEDFSEWEMPLPSSIRDDGVELIKSNFDGMMESILF